MATTRRAKSSRSASGRAKAKSLSSEKAREVRGGVIAIIAPADPTLKQTELLPYIEQKPLKR